jgi:hypothetical protein
MAAPDAGAGGPLQQLSPNAPPVNMLRPADVQGGGARLRCPAPGCSREFQTAANVRIHARTHTADEMEQAGPLPNDPPLRRGVFHCFVASCKFAAAGKTLANLRSAQKHYDQVHVADKPCACAVPGCTASFAKAHQLNRHVKNAHGGTVCKCGLDLQSKKALTEHVKQYAKNLSHLHAPLPLPAAAED